MDAYGAHGVAGKSDGICDSNAEGQQSLSSFALYQKGTAQISMLWPSIRSRRASMCHLKRRNTDFWISI